MNERKKRGFAAMSKEDVTRIAAMGGKAAQAAGTGHRYNSETGSAAAAIAVARRRANRPTQPDVNAPLPSDDA